MSVVSVVCCYRSLRRADHLPRGVLLNVVRHCVRSRNFVNEEVLVYWGLSRQKQRNKRRQQSNYGRRLLPFTAVPFFAIQLFDVCVQSALLS
jgi:hypothetical protein